MFDAGMLTLGPGARTPVLRAEAAVAALFGVAKKGSDKLRVILDRRRRNAMEKSLPRVLSEALAAGPLRGP